MTEWIGKFTVADQQFRRDRGDMLEQKVYRSPRALFAWAEDASRKALAISEAFDGLQVSVGICDRIALRTGANGVFMKIIRHGAQLGVEPWENSESLKILAQGVLIDYLDQKGLVKHGIKDIEV